MKTSLYRVVMDFLLSWPSMGGVLMREASVTIVEKVAEIGDESNPPSVTTSTNSVLTAAVSVLLVICVSRGWSSRKSSYLFLGRGGFSEGSMVIFVLFIYMFGFLFQIPLLSNGKRSFSCQSWYQSLYIWSMFLSSEKGFPCHFGDWISFPFHIVLVPSPSSLMFEDCFYFIYFFSFK